MLVLSFTALALLLKAINGAPHPGPRLVLPRQDQQGQVETGGCFRGNYNPSIDDMTIDTRGTRGPGKNNAYLIMNSISKATLASQVDRIYDLVDPTSCQPRLFTDHTDDPEIKEMDRNNAWFITAAMIAERDFATQPTRGTLKRGWELMTDKPVDYLKLDGCQPESIQAMAELLARVPGYPLTAQWDPTRAPQINYKPPSSSEGAYAMTYGTIIGAKDHSFGFVPGDQKWQIQVSLEQVCDASFEVWGPSCLEPVGVNGTAADACFGPRAQRW